jgi:sRNA-binding regulator protein Hfq
MKAKAKYWDPIVESYAISGLTKIQFCKKHQLPYNQFRYYQKKSQTNNQKSLEQSFEQIIIAKKPTDLIADRVIALTVHLPNTIKLDIKIEKGNAFSILLKDLVALC